MTIDPRELLPRHKGDSERTRALIALGYPAVAPVLRDLLEWVQDGNWPISKPVGRFLASVGEPVIPLIREVFAGTDDCWKYSCIYLIVMQFPREVAEQMRADLQRLANHPSLHEHEQEVDQQAREALEWLDGGEHG